MPDITLGWHRPTHIPMLHDKELMLHIQRAHADRHTGQRGARGSIDEPLAAYVETLINP